MSDDRAGASLQLVALDFDGVISDSAPEAFVVALQTYVALAPGSRLTALAEQLDGRGAPGLSRVVGSDVYRSFVEIMPLGNRAEDYGVVLRAIESGREVPHQAAYTALREAQEPDWLDRFHECFYGIRSELAARDPEGWQALMAPYPGLLEVLRRRAGDVILAIATAKDRSSVEALLRLYGIADLFGPSRLLDKEAGVSKSDHLELLRHSQGIPYEQIAFIDDKVNHLDDVSPLGVRCALAGWGYNGEREAELAQRRGYLYCTLADVEARLFGSESAA